MEQDHNKPLLSFIVPAFNEGDTIEQNLSSIHEFASSFNFELIVVDNGSTDDTATKAKSSNAIVVAHPDGTISSVRNAGVKLSTGEILVFLDADVSLTEEWAAHIQSELNSFAIEPLRIIGSRCATDGKNRFVNRYWFDRLHRTTTSYVNTGHMITTRKLFNALQGFDEQKPTGEDYDFCMRAQEIGASVVNISTLKVIHYGYPANISGFFQRERWHGLDDVKSFSTLVKSKVALTAITLLGILALGVLGSLLYQHILPFAIATVLFIFAIALIAFKKFGRSTLSELIGSSIMLIIYFTARLASFTLSDKSYLRQRRNSTESEYTK